MPRPRQVHAAPSPRRAEAGDPGPCRATASARRLRDGAPRPRRRRDPSLRACPRRRRSPTAMSAMDAVATPRTLYFVALSTWIVVSLPALSLTVMRVAGLGRDLSAADCRVDADGHRGERVAAGLAAGVDVRADRDVGLGRRSGPLLVGRGPVDRDDLGRAVALLDGDGVAVDLGDLATGLGEPDVDGDRGERVAALGPGRVDVTADRDVGLRAGRRPELVDRGSVDRDDLGRAAVLLDRDGRIADRGDLATGPRRRDDDGGDRVGAVVVLRLSEVISSPTLRSPTLIVWPALVMVVVSVTVIVRFQPSWVARAGRCR